MALLNLGILAHVDAGKTSLTERLLHDAGVIDEIGSVDAGSTQTDSLALERQRGITIKSAVVSFAIGDVTVNLIDTPGHPDFIAEVERVLGVLDGAVLVVSAVEGVQAQTRVLMRALRRLRHAHAAVRQQDRPCRRRPRAGGRGASPGRLTPAVVPMGAAGDARHPGAACATVPRPGCTARLLGSCSRSDDGCWPRTSTDGPSRRAAAAELAAQTRRALVHPVFFGSAITGAGVAALTDGIASCCPPPAGDPDGAAVRHGVQGRARPGRREDRLRAAVLRHAARRATGCAAAASRRSPASACSTAAAARPRPSVDAGQIGKLWGLRDVRIGDAVGVPRDRAGRAHFAPPTLETVVVPAPGERRARCTPRSAQLAEQDPLIDLRQDDVRQELYVSLYGEVQKEVMQATLADDYGLAVTFRETTTICVERPAGTGEAYELMGEGQPVPGHGRAAGGARRRSAAGSSSGWRWSSARCRTRSSAAVEDTVRRDAAARACTAGRSWTAWSR